MKSPATALSMGAVDFPNYCLDATVSSEGSQENREAAISSGNGRRYAIAASGREAETKFAIHSVENYGVKRGWKVTDSHLIFFGKIR